MTSSPPLNRKRSYIIPLLIFVLTDIQNTELTDWSAKNGVLRADVYYPNSSTFPRKCCNDNILSVINFWRVVICMITMCSTFNFFFLNTMCFWIAIQADIPESIFSRTLFVKSWNFIHCFVMKFPYVGPILRIIGSHS